MNDICCLNYLDEYEDLSPTTALYKSMSKSYAYNGDFEVR